MQTENDTSKPEPSPRQEAGEGWLPPETAPHDGTPIIGDFGWPWANFAVWDECDEEWCIATIQACPIIDRQMNTWIETDTEKRGALKSWMPLPYLPNAIGEARADNATSPQDQTI
jgi:hypothetical protein